MGSGNISEDFEIIVGFGCVIHQTETGIGTGRKNTIAIDYVDKGSAASAALNEQGWFLPSRDELLELYKVKGSISGLTGKYWSSSDDGMYSLEAIAVDFSSSGNDPSVKEERDETLSVLRIRAF